MTTDMTKGSPARLILVFMIPLLIGNIFQQLYNMADTIIVGRTISVGALAAVGATGAISFLIIGFVQGITSGFAVITAQRYGANDKRGVRRSVAVSIILSAAVTIIVTIISMYTTRPLLELMKTPSDIIEQSYEYIIIIFAGIAAPVFFNLFSSILRALGDSRTPLVFLVVASVINIVLDFTFILIFNMGVAGAGLATVIAQFISGIWCFIYSIRKYSILHLTRNDWEFSWKFAWKHLQVGLPMAFQFSITAIGTMLIQSALNSLGSTAVAAFTTGSKIDQFATQPLASLGVAIATYCAQNYGAKKLDRIKKGVSQAAIIGIIFSVIGGIVIVIFAKPLVSLFVGNGQEEVMALARKYLVINAIFYISMALLFVYRNTMQGIDRGMTAFIGGVWELAMRALVAFLLVEYLKFTAVCIASPVAWTGATIWLVIVYIIDMKKLKKQTIQ